jgi:hypothetical protein
MGTYASIAIRDANGNITGYQSTSTGLPTETTSTAYQQALKQSGYVNQSANNNMSNAADIASSISRTGGAVDVNVARKAILEGANPSQVNVATNQYVSRGSDLAASRVNVPVSELSTKSIGVETGISTFPTVDKSIAGQMPSVLGSSVKNFTTVDAAVGEGQGIKIREAQIIGDYNTGEFGIYQKSYFDGKERLYLSLVGGGGRNALQSGAFAYGDDSLSPSDKTYEQWNAGKIASLSSDYFDKYSGRGSEVYGGKSGVLLDANKTVESGGAKLSTYADKYNLATLSNPQGVNMAKSETGSLDLPLSKTASDAAITILNYGTKGNTLEVKDTSSAGLNVTPVSPKISTGTSDDIVSTLPQPYVSKAASSPTSSSIFNVSKSLVDIGIAKGENVLSSTGITGATDGIVSGISKAYGYTSEKFLEGTIFAPKIGNSTSESSKTTISGGNSTITSLDTWINANMNKIDNTNATQVNEYNKNVGTYNLMSKQNPVVTSTETTKSTSSSDIVTGKGESNFLSGLYSNAAGWGESVIGDLTSKSAWQDALSGKGLPEQKSGTEGLIAGISTTPVGGTAGLLERYGIPIAGTVAAAVIGKSASESGFDLSSQPGVQKAQELWEGIGGTIQLPTAPTLPKISDVIPSVIYNAPGEGFKQIANVPGQGLGIITGLPGIGRDLIAKTEGAISLPFSGGNSVISMPKSNIFPSDVVSPVPGYVDVAKGLVGNSIISDRKLYDLSVDVAGKTIAKTEESIRSASDYSTKLSDANTADRGAIATPYWWDRAANLDKITDKANTYDATQYGNAVVNRVTTKDLVTTLPSSNTDITNIDTLITQSTTQTGSKTTYDSLDASGKGDPTYDLKRRDLTWPGGSGGSGGERRGGSYRFINTFNVGFGVGNFDIGSSRRINIPSLRNTAMRTSPLVFSGARTQPRSQPKSRPMRLRLKL